MSYPRFLYHKDLAPEGLIVRSEAHRESLGDGWVESYTEAHAPTPPAPAESKDQPEAATPPPLPAGPETRKPRRRGHA